MTLSFLVRLDTCNSHTLVAQLLGSRLRKCVDLVKMSPSRRSKVQPNTPCSSSITRLRRKQEAIQQICIITWHSNSMVLGVAEHKVVNLWTT